MIRRFAPVLLALGLCACTSGASLETRWPAHPDDAAILEERIDRRLSESLDALGALSLALETSAHPEEALAAATRATAAAAALRALAQARTAMAGIGADGQRALLFAAAAAACHEGVAKIGPRIGAEDGRLAPATALRRAQVACLACQTLRVLPVAG
jgi:hypothetical protein